MSKSYIKNQLSEDDGTMVADATIGLVKVGAVAAITLVGGPAAGFGAGIVGELGGALLERRKQRLATFWTRFADKYQSLTEPQRRSVVERLQTSEGEDLFEAVWESAGRIIDEEKLTNIAALLGNGLSAEELSGANARRLLLLLEELDHAEIIILQSFSWRIIEKTEEDTYGSDVESEYEKQSDLKAAFLERHKDVFEFAKKPEYPQPPSWRHNIYPWFPTTNEQIPPMPDLPDDQLKEWEERQQQEQERRKAELATYEKELLTSNIEEEKHALFKHRLSHLVEQGLLGNKSTSYPQSPLDSLDLTPLGVALLKIIDLADWDEWGRASSMNTVDAIQYAQGVSESAHKQISAHEKAQSQQRQQDEVAGGRILRELQHAFRNIR